MNRASDGVLVHARTFLFVPGDRPDRFDKAATSGADVVILDLEDAVAAEAKDEARTAVSAWLRGGRAVVRINADWPTRRDDLDQLRDSTGLLGVMVPKSESLDVLAEIAGLLDGVAVIPLIESAKGVAGARLLAGHAHVVRLALGTLDLSVDMDIAVDSLAMDVLAAEVVLASRLAGLPSPIAGVTTAVHSEVAAFDDAAASRRNGYGAKLLIHPSQVAPVAAAMCPSVDDVAWARRVLAAVGDGSVALVGGAMADRPVVERARRILFEHDVEEKHGPV